MMFSAKLKYARIACTKVFLISKKIRGMAVLNALNVLEFSTKKSARLVKKLLCSAVANARVKNFNSDVLYIKKIFADQASSLKRLKCCAKGRSSRILKRTCHITIELSKTM